ncbi:sirohydrochlorin chelatase [Actinophytocola oryzae]|uniref:Sirohydrochlorin ferrochelatase n=1 Tax=Actinophytocola oryzae TaxID=502181 RepID=A0A4R7W012_9PSEU|nr:sirohydrochlorin chelatase [Actinophytocola oryzae]TDV55159.1 sirohydrochlorin ferrochelatase [Actinophytocola oryzae]
MSPPLVLVAHGTRNPAGTATTEALADLVREWVTDVRVAYADVCQPDVTTVLREVDGPAIVVPAFLAAGYHVLVDLPEQVRASGVPAVITPHLGADLVAVARQRLLEAGWRPGQRIVLAASGSSDAQARTEVRTAARRLGAERVGFVAACEPALGTVTTKDTAVASWFLAPGLFHDRATHCGARTVAAPLGVHPAIAQLIVLRYATVREHWVSEGLPGLGRRVSLRQ